MVNVRLAARAALLRSDETLPQSLSGSSCRRIIAAVWGFFDVVTRSCNSLCQKHIGPISPQPAGLGRRRVRAGRAVVLLHAVCDYRDGDCIFCRPGSGDRRRRKAARLILTRQAQNSAMTETDVQDQPLRSHQGDVQLRRAIWRTLPWMCRSFAPGTAITITDPIVSGSLTGPFAYSLPPSGSPNTIVVRAFYQWPLFVTRLGYNIGKSQRQQAAALCDRRFPCRAVMR